MFEARGQALGCSKCPQRRIWEHASDLVELFRDGGEETKKRLNSRSTRLRFERFHTSSFTLYIGLRDVYDAVLIKNFQVSPKPFVCWTARFKRDLCAVGEPNWWLHLYLISQAARPAACTQYESPSWWEGHTCTKIGHWTQHTSTALRSLWNGKAMTYFLLDLASCTTVHAALGLARTVCGSQLMTRA